jgi:hypothetical protein
MTDTPIPGFDLEKMRDYAKRGYAYPCADILALIDAYEAEQERADHAESFCYQAAKAAGDHDFVCAEAVSIRAERDALVRENDRLAHELTKQHGDMDATMLGWDDLCERSDKAEDERDALAELLARAGEAMAPLAEVSAVYDDTFDDDDGVDGSDVLVGSLRRARVILADIEARLGKGQTETQKAPPAG